MKFFSLKCNCPGCKGPLIMQRMNEKNEVNIEAIPMFRTKEDAQIHASQLFDETEEHPKVVEVEVKII